MKIEELIKENILLKEENEKLKIKLEKYYNSRQSFYEKNKDYVKQKANERLKKLAEENPEKLKQYRRTAYLNQKEKRKQKELEIKN